MRIKQDVGGLEIAVKHAVGMGMTDRLKDGAENLHRLLRRHRAFTQQLRKIPTLHVFQNKIRTFMLIHQEIMHSDNVGMGKLGQHIAFTLQAFRLNGIRTRLQHFDGHLTIEPDVARQLDHPHAAMPEQPVDFIAI